jgi:hypothetical protein
MARSRPKSIKRRTEAKASKFKLRARVHGSTLELLEPAPLLLRDGEEVLVTLSETKRKPDLDSLRSSFGGWKGLVDTDALLRNIYASRSVKSRRPIPRL